MGNLKKKIAIIGAGSSGLTAIKCCLDEGLEPVCIERSSDIGGLWNYSEGITEGNPSIYNSLVINTSKEMMMYSDFPPPENFPYFLKHTKVLEYFRLYAEQFRLLRYISFNTEVKYIRKSEDYDTTGRYEVRYASGSGETSEVFDGVMICSGHHSKPYVPDIPGIETFQGRVLHSHAYKDARAFHNQRVVILGLGNSAIDIACDLAKSAKQVYLSSRRGAWIVPRTAFWGLPADMIANSRVVFSFPMKWLDWCVQVQANFRIDHDTYGLRPQHGVLSCHPTINDELPIHLVTGRVQTRPKITRVVKSGVWFEDESFCPCDVIILATGYDYKVDFVEHEIFKVEENRTMLYKYVFPPHLNHPTLAVIGLIQAIGAVMPIAELQCRWYARLITGKVKLPARDVMEKDIEMKKEKMCKLYVDSRRHTLQTFWIDYMDQVASQIGVRPNLWKMLFVDPELAIKCYLGPCLPSQYRLTGPGAWKDAREYIINTYERAKRCASKHKISKIKSKHRESATQNGGGVQDKGKRPEQSRYISTAAKRVNCFTKLSLLKSCPDSDDIRTSKLLNDTNLLSPHWTTIPYYIMVMLVCCCLWLISILLNHTGLLVSILYR